LGPGVNLLVTNSSTNTAIKETLATGTQVLTCKNSLRSAGLEPDVFTPGVGIVQAALAHFAVRQWDGWAYARL
jgi:intracellular sulfur oxidation DsrE/DsrF family protein